MAKTALIERELKRKNLAAKYAAKYAELKAVAGDVKRSEEERAQARLALQKLPRNANPPAQSLRNYRASTWHISSIWTGASQDSRNGLFWRYPWRNQGKLVIWAGDT